MPFLTTWPRKRAPKKHYKNRGFGKAFLEKQLYVTQWPLLDKKNTNPEISVIVFFAFFFSFNNKKPKLAGTPIFSVLAKLKKEKFQNFRLKHRKKNQFLHPFLKKKR